MDAAQRTVQVVQRDLVEGAKHTAAFRSSKYNRFQFGTFLQCKLGWYANHAQEVAHPCRELGEQSINQLHRDCDTEQGPFVRNDDELARNGQHHVPIPLSECSRGFWSTIDRIFVKQPQQLASASQRINRDLLSANSQTGDAKGTRTTRPCASAILAGPY